MYFISIICIIHLHFFVLKSYFTDNKAQQKDILSRENSKSPLLATILYKMNIML